jgi:hypothetical protein
MMINDSIYLVATGLKYTGIMTEQARFQQGLSLQADEGNLIQYGDSPGLTKNIIE